MSRPSRGYPFAVVDPIVYTGHDFEKASGVQAVAPRSGTKVSVHRSFLLTRGLDATHSRATWRRPVRLRNIPTRILQILPADARLRHRRVLSESSAAAFCASHGVLRVDRGRSDAVY